ncbi:MAG: glycyl radical protein [Firmicutes bacterium]|nr:glycyl radical protein [Bacillota bacterium]
MNERVTRLRDQSLSTKPYISIERARLVTDVYRQYAGKVSAPMLRAYTFARLMEQKQVYIGEGELIVGERGEAPQATPTYPELCCHSLEDLELINSREKISFRVSDEVKRIQAEEIIPYWQGRSMRDRIFSAMSQDWLDCYEAGIFTEFMEQRAPGHTVADGKIYRYGFRDFQERIRKCMQELDFAQDPLAYDRREQLRAMDICAEAIIRYGERHAEQAEKLAAVTEDPHRQQELLRIAQVCRRVPAEAPRDFWEALQMYWFVHIGVITELNTWDSFNPGRLDQHLWPFYEKGLQEGTLTREKAKELLQCFWIKFNNQPAPPKVGVTLAESGTYTDFANINVGGLAEDGSNGVNEVSYLLLEVIDEMRLLQPSSNIQLSKKNPDRFLRRACEIVRKGWGQPSMFNADAVVAELLRQGKSLGDARAGGTSGCVETGAFGKEAYILTGYLNLVKILEITLHDGIDPRTGKRLGPSTGQASQFTDFTDLMRAYQKQLEHFVNIKVQGSNIIDRLYANHMPAPFLSVIIDDCIAKGLDYNAGGARYNTNYIQGVGIGTLTDCFSAIKEHVFVKGNIKLTELVAALSHNFVGYEQLRRLLSQQTPRYGNDLDAADSIMQALFQVYYQTVNGRPTVKGGTYRINMLPTTCHVYFGSVTGATPDGRLAGEPFSEGISPVQGADRSGPTAVIKSAAKMDHLLTGGTLLNLKFTPSLLASDEGLTGLMHLIRTYFRMDGHHIQFNVVSADTLREAQQNPEAYRHLIVRVAGYSDYFVNLSRALQDEIIARTEHTHF